MAALPPKAKYHRVRPGQVVVRDLYRRDEKRYGVVAVQSAAEPLREPTAELPPYITEKGTPTRTRMITCYDAATRAAFLESHAEFPAESAGLLHQLPSWSELFNQKHRYLAESAARPGGRC